MHVLFPLPYYSKRLVRQRQKRIFEKFIKLLRDKWGLQGEVEEASRSASFARRIPISTFSKFTRG